MEEKEKVVVEAEVVDKNEGIKHKTYKHSLREVVFSTSTGFLMIVAIVAFLLLGIIGNFWYCAWIVFFVPDIISSIIRAIKKRRLCLVNITFICLAVFFFVCMACPGRDANLWHPMWVVFLLIPAWYIFFGKVDANYHKDDSEVGL